MKKIILNFIISITLILNLYAQEFFEKNLKISTEPRISFSILKENKNFISLEKGYEIIYTVDKELFNQNDIDKIEINKYSSHDAFSTYLFGDTCYSITFYINERKKKELSEFTKNNIGKHLLMTINDTVISRGVISEEISSSAINMSGSLTDGILYKLLANFECINNIKAKLPEEVIYIPVQEYDLNPYEVNTKNAFEVVNAFFYFFLRDDDTFKKFIATNSKEDFEVLRATYKEKRPFIYLQTTPDDCDCLYVQLSVYENGNHIYYDSCVVLQKNDDEVKIQVL